MAPDFRGEDKPVNSGGTPPPPPPPPPASSEEKETVEAWLGEETLTRDVAGEDSTHVESEEAKYSFQATTENEDFPVPLPPMPQETSLPPVPPMPQSAPVPPPPMPGPIPGPVPPASFPASGVPPYPQQPQQQVPQYGYPQNPEGYAQAGYPQGAYVAPVPAGPSAFGLTWSAMWRGQWSVWAGKPKEAFDMTNSVQARTGNGWLAWFVSLLTNAILIGIFVAASYASAVRSANRVAGNFFEVFSGGAIAETTVVAVDFQLVVMYFFLFTILAFSFLFFRGLCVFWARRVTGSTVGFSQALNDYATAMMVVWFPIAILAGLSVIGVVPLFLPFIVIAAVGIGIMAEVMIWQGVANDPQYKRNPITIYAWFTVIAYGLVLISFMIVYYGGMFAAATLNPFS